PDVVLLDAEMPDLDVPAAVRLLRARSPASAIVVLSLNPAAGARARPEGAVVVVGKHEGTAGLLAATRGRRRRPADPCEDGRGASPRRSGAPPSRGRPKIVTSGGARDRLASRLAGARRGERRDAGRRGRDDGR